MTVVGKEDMHTSVVAHDHSLTNSALIHTEQVQGRAGGGDIIRGALSKKLQAVKGEAAEL